MNYTYLMYTYLMLKFKDWLLEHDFLTDPRQNIGDRETSLGSNFLGKTPKYSLENKRITITEYRKPPIVSTIKDNHSDKPWGGLWYGQGNAWLHYLSTDMTNSISMFVHEIFINPEKICLIHDQDACFDFARKYGDYKNDRFGDMRFFIKWDEVKKDYSGIECFGQGYKRKDWQYSWDVPSGVIWEESALKDTKLLYVYDVKTKEFKPARDLKVYAGMASKIKNPLP